MRYINGIPIALNRKIKSRQILSLFIILFILICFLTFFSLPDLSNVISKRYRPNIYPIENDSYNQIDIGKPISNPDAISVEKNEVLAITYKPIDIFKQDIQNLDEHITSINKKNVLDTQIFNFVQQGKKDSLDNSDGDKMDEVKSMMKFAWDGYTEYAFGDNELKPISKTSHYGSIFGSNKIGLTIIDSLDTLLVMGLFEEYGKAREWVPNLSFRNMKGSISVFETNIRYIGGFLATYILTMDELLLQKAIEIADAIMPAFDTEYGLPYSLVNIDSKTGQNYFWAKSLSFILAEIGTLHLEFELLSILSGDDKYYEKVATIRKFMNQSAFCHQGLVNNYIRPENENKTTKLRDVSLGGLGDSYYEYLIKSYMITGGKDVQGKEMFYASWKGIQNLLLKTSPGGLLYLAQIRNEAIENNMDHLACFFGGLLALTSTQEKDAAMKKELLDTAEKLTLTCRIGYTNADLQLAPEVLGFDTEGKEAKAPTTKQSFYILRPETFETYFYLWRVTKDQKYRDWAWEAVQALQAYARVGVGYSGIRNVYSPKPDHDDVQQSFFMAESLKYLYLTFTSDSYFPLDDWIFNTEGHPFLKHSLIPTKILEEGRRKIKNGRN